MLAQDGVDGFDHLFGALATSRPRTSLERLDRVIASSRHSASEIGLPACRPALAGSEQRQLLAELELVLGVVAEHRVRHVVVCADLRPRIGREQDTVQSPSVRRCASRSCHHLLGELRAALESRDS